VKVGFGAAGVRAYTSSLLNKSQHSVILSEASEYQRAAFGALNQFRRESKDLHFGL
jgi:hypothetical protein